MDRPTPVWGDDTATEDQPEPGPEPDAYAVVSLACAAAAIGFLFGPIETFAFAWAFGAAAVVLGTCSRQGRPHAIAGVLIGLVVAFASLVV